MSHREQKKSVKKNSRSQNHDSYNGDEDGPNKMHADKKLKQKKNIPYDDESQNVSFKAITAPFFPSKEKTLLVMDSRTKW